MPRTGRYSQWTERSKCQRDVQTCDPESRSGLDHAASGSKLGMDATKKLSGEGFKRPWQPFIKTNDAVKANVERTFNPEQPT